MAIRLGGARVVGRRDGIRGIGMMRNGRRGVEGGPRGRLGEGGGGVVGRRDIIREIGMMRSGRRDGGGGVRFEERISLNRNLIAEILVSLRNLPRCLRGSDHQAMHAAPSQERQKTGKDSRWNQTVQ